MSDDPVMDLIPCARCRRHVRADEPRCPFCALSRTPAAVSRPTLVGRLGRAAVFAGVAGCAPTPPPQHVEPPHDMHETPPPPPPPDDTRPPDDGHFAQPPQGAAAIEGYITNAAHQPMANVRVTLSWPNTQATNMLTDAQGHYRFDVTAGRYRISVEVEGDGNPRHGPPPPVIRDVEVAAGATQRADFQVNPPPPYVDRGPCCKPYGAPPARRRVV
jgi:carboxypeptidase family protein